MESHTFDGRFADNVETFSVELVADVVIVVLMDILVEEAYFPSCFAVMNKPTAFALDLEDSQTCVVDN